MTDAPLGRSATYTVLTTGYVGDLWWHADGPADDPVAPDREVLRASRLRVLAAADLIVPGHGAPFQGDENTPR